MRRQIQLWVGLWKPSSRKNRMLRILGHDVAPNARVGRILIQGSTRLTLGDDAHIGHFTVLKDVDQVVLGDHASLGRWNWITAAPALARKAGAPARLELGEHTAVTGRHYLDCSGGIVIGAFTTVAGVRSTIITHGIDWRDAVQKAQGVTIGDYAMVGSNVTVCPGSAIPDRAVVGMGTVIGRGTLGPGMLVAGPRGQEVRPVDGAYFAREVGDVA